MKTIETIRRTLGILLCLLVFTGMMIRVTAEEPVGPSSRHAGCGYTDEVRNSPASETSGPCGTEASPT